MDESETECWGYEVVMVDSNLMERYGIIFVCESMV